MSIKYYGLLDDAGRCLEMGATVFQGGGCVRCSVLPVAVGGPFVSEAGNLAAAGAGWCQGPRSSDLQTNDLQGSWLKLRPRI